MVNEWTRDDLPDRYDLQRLKSGIVQPFFFDDILDAVVAHLNANGGVPASREDAALADRLERQAATICELQGSFLRVESAAARWRRAHEIVEQERDTARERLREVDSALAKCMSDFQDMEDESDEWRSRAEAAEARTAPAVTKRELRSVVVAHDPGDDELAASRVNALTDRLWSLVSGADPAVHVVRESDLPEVWNNDDDAWESPSRLMRPDEVPRLRGLLDNALGDVAFYEAVARAIEAGQATDPVEERARELWDVARPSDDVMWRDLTSEAQQEYRRIAAHVLGQGDRHVDQ